MHKLLLTFLLIFLLLACDSIDEIQQVESENNINDSLMANTIEDKDHEHDEDKDHEHDEDKDHEHDEDKDHEHDENHELSFSYYLEEFGTQGLLNIEKLDGIDLSWPREVEAMNGKITIEEKPNRILTISVGHDEMLFGFADIDTIVAVSSFSQSETGNIYDLTKDLPTISSEIETIIAQEPDLVFADPYANSSLIESLIDVGITVVQTQLNNDYIGRINDILFASYVIGQTENVSKLISVIEEKISIIDEFKGQFDIKPSVLSVTYYDAYWAAGAGSTEGSIIELAGGLNIASENGVESNNMITKEALIDMNPEYIVIPQSIEWGGQDFYDSLFADESFESIDAIINKNVYLVDTSYFTTLSHWNIVGAEKLMEIIWEDEWNKVVGDLPEFYSCMNCDIYN
ncbi:MAG: ABC transporter substrate-binding protein [Chloroflexota bacterium]|nr:ABC transporter substrate-binding protein [Chloroflexota bacterium]